MLSQQFVHKVVAAIDHRCLGVVPAGVTVPDEHLVHGVALIGGALHGDVGLALVVDETAGAPVSVGGDQHAALRVDDAVSARRAGEAAEDLRVHDAQPGAGEHGDRQLRDHRHVEGDAVARFQTSLAKHGRELVHPDPKPPGYVTASCGSSSGSGTKTSAALLRCLARWRSTQL